MTQPPVVGNPARCPLCSGPGGEILWEDALLRVILADEPANPGFTRIVWNAHVAEMTDLREADRDRLMAAVWAVEAAMRETLRPDKINLASLGNVVPHLHWHVIPRWHDDAQFPQPVWAGVVPGREDAPIRLRERVDQGLVAYRRALAARLDVA